MFVNDLVTGFQIGVGIFAAVALIINFLSFRNDRKSDETKLAESVFKDVRQLDAHHLNLRRNYKYEGHEDEYLDWASSFFNTLEWLSFLVNHNKLRDNEIISFFKPAILDWYESTFLDTKYITKDQINDAKEFPEFKTLYQDLRNGKFKHL